MSVVSRSYGQMDDKAVAQASARREPWKVTRIKFVATLNPSKSEVAALADDTQVTFLPMEAIGENGELDLSRTRALGDVRAGYTYLRDGDVCIAKITPCFENGKGAVVEGAVSGIAFGTTELIPIRCHRGSDARFLYYVLKAPPFKAHAEASMFGAGGQKRVADSFAANYTVSLPPPDERATIAHFLDHETAKIDRLIEKQQQLAALLKEKRQAVISHAVAKGLNPDAPMKDSGVEWLGEVPAHWTMCQLRHWIDAIEQGKSPECERRSADGNEWGVLKTGCVNDGVFDATENKALPSNVAPFNDSEVKVGDVLMSRASGSVDLIGSVAYVEMVRPRILLSDKIFRVRLRSAVDPRFFAYLMRSSQMRSLIVRSISGADGMANNITKASILAFEAEMPPFHDQVEIAAHVAAETRKIDLLTDKAADALSLLAERRTALISAAVTGKIDVRNWQPAATEHPIELEPA